MTWLLKLHPPRWRRRYGPELAELISAQPFSMALVADLMTGAIDAWLHPGLAAVTTGERREETPMITRLLQLECAGHGRNVTASDTAKSAAVMIGGTLLLAMVWVWAQWQIGRNRYVTALLPMAWLLPYLLGLRYTSLKGRSVRAQTVFIVGLGAVLTLGLLLIGWIDAQF